MSNYFLINRDKLRGCMAEHRTTQEEIAVYLGITRASMNNKMTQKTDFNEKEIALLRNKFGDVIFFTLNIVSK